MILQYFVIDIRLVNCNSCYVFYLLLLYTYSTIGWLFPCVSNLQKLVQA